MTADPDAYRDSPHDLVGRVEAIVASEYDSPTGKLDRIRAALDRYRQARDGGTPAAGRVERR